MKSTHSEHYLGTKGLSEKDVKEYYGRLKVLRKTLNKNAGDRLAVENLNELPGGLRFFYQVWSATMRGTEKIPKAIVVAFHPMYSHSDIFYPLADALNSKGVMVVAFDYRGHGRTGGQAGGNLGDVKSFKPIYSDAIELIRKFHQEFGVPLYLLGVDIGSIVAMHVAIDIIGVPIQGLVMVSPAVKQKDNVKNILALPLLMMAELVKKGEPMLNVPPEPVKSTLFEEWVEYTQKDPFRLKKMSSRYHKNLIRLSLGAAKLLKKIDVPCLIMQGTHDSRVDHFAVHEIYQKWPHPQKFIRLYENAGHNLFADRFTQEIYQEIFTFLKV